MIAIKFFYEIGEKVKAEDFKIACRLCHDIIVKFSLDHISDEELNSPVNESYAVHCIYQSESPKIIEAVLNRGENINLLDKIYKKYYIILYFIQKIDIFLKKLVFSEINFFEPNIIYQSPQ